MSQREYAESRVTWICADNARLDLEIIMFNDIKAW